MTSGRIAQSIRLVTLAVTVVIAVASAAHAHNRTTSYSSWHLSQRHAKVVLRMSEVDVATLPWAAGGTSRFDDALARYAVEHLVMRAGEHACEVSEQPHRLDGPAGRVALEWRVACPAQGPLSIHSDVLLETRSSHLHFRQPSR